MKELLVGATLLVTVVVAKRKIASKQKTPRINVKISESDAAFIRSAVNL